MSTTATGSQLKQPFRARAKVWILEQTILPNGVLPPKNGIRQRNRTGGSFQLTHGSQKTAAYGFWFRRCLPDEGPREHEYIGLYRGRRQKSAGKIYVNGKLKHGNWSFDVESMNLQKCSVGWQAILDNFKKYNRTALMARLLQESNGYRVRNWFPGFLYLVTVFAG